MKFSDLIVSLGDLVISTGSRNCDLHGAAAITAAMPSSISFVMGVKYRAALEKTNAAAVILPDRPELVAIAEERGLCWLTTANPRLAFARTIEEFYVPFRPAPGVDRQASVDPDTAVGDHVSIASGVAIYYNVTLGDHVCLLPNVTIYPGVTIGAGTTIHAGVTLYQDTQIGEYCTIHAGAQIGADGFGFVQTPTGWAKMPQSGYVKLGDFVEVGANSAIDRPAVGVTSIGLGTKIDNLVQVGHGCTIGEHCLLCGLVGVAGGVTVGDFSVLAGQSGVVDGVTIAPGSIIAAQSVVRQNTKPGQWAGDPLLPLPQWLKLAAKLKRLARS